MTLEKSAVRKGNPPAWPAGRRRAIPGRQEQILADMYTQCQADAGAGIHVVGRIVVYTLIGDLQRIQQIINPLLHRLPDIVLGAVRKKRKRYSWSFSFASSFSPARKKYLQRLR